MPKSFSPSMIEVIIADDSSAFRRALNGMLESLGDIRIVAEAKNGKEAVKLAVSLVPRVIIMDIGMPVLNGLRATRQITDYLSQTKVLILSAHSDSEYVEEAIRCGAEGYLLKNLAPSVLAKAIRQIDNGRMYFDPPISPGLLIQCRGCSGKSVTLKTEITKTLACSHRTQLISVRGS